MRNVLRPTVKSGRPSTLTKLLAALVTIALVGLYWIAPPDWTAMPTDMVEKVTLTYDPNAFDPESDGDESDLVSADDEEERSLNGQESSQQPAKESPAEPSVMNPAHEEQTAPAPVESRPVAAAATPPEKVAQPHWRVRLGLCLYAASCDEIARTLAAKGMAVVVRPSTASLTTTRVVVGPWSTPQQARDAEAILAKNSVTMSLLTSGGKSYLTSSPLGGETAAARMAQKVAGYGYATKLSTRKELRRVKKVFLAKTYADKKQANAHVTSLAKKGITSVAEFYTEQGNTQ